MPRATSRPRSSSTSASARSMPAVTPAEVATWPSRTWTGSGSTSTDGWSRASLSQYAQWVVARRPSSRPAAASRIAPVRTDTRRSARGPCSRSQATTPGAGFRVPWPPGTSRACGVADAVSAWSGTVRPLEVRTAAPSGEAVRMRYEPGTCSSPPWKTSRGP